MSSPAQWKLLGAYAAAAAIAGLALSITNAGIAAPQWHFDLSDRLDTLPSQFVDDPRWIAMLAAVLTVSGPWLPARWRRWWWALLLAFVPIHLVISAVVPARSLFGLAVGWFIGALVVLVVGTPGLEVPLEGAVRAMARRGCVVSALKVVRPSGAGPLILQAECEHQQTTAVMEMYGPHQRGGGVLLQLWRKVRLRDRETAPLHASMRRAVEHRALMAIAIGQLKIANISTIAVAALERSWTLYAHTPVRGTPIGDCTAAIPVNRVWESLRELHDCQISHGDLRASEITVDETVLFGGFDSAEYGATDAQLRSDIAQLLVTTTHLYDAPSAVRAAIDVFGKDTVLSASRRLTKAAVPSRIRQSVRDPKAVISAARDEVKSQTRVDEIRTETVTRFTRGQLIQLVLLFALVYVAYPFISSVPTFLTELRTANWWFALLGLAASMLTYLGAAAALWAAADGVVKLWGLIVMQVANKFAATTTPAGVGGLALSARYLQKGGLTPMHATTAVALQQSVQVITHVLLLIFFSTAAGVSANLSRFVPSVTVLYLVAGLAAGSDRHLPAGAQVAAMAGDVGASAASRGDRPPHRARTRTQAPGSDRARLRGNDSRQCLRTVGRHRGVRRRHVVHHRHRRDDDRWHLGFCGPDTGRRRRGRGGVDRWSGRLRDGRGDRRSVGAALPGADDLAAGVRRLAGHAVDDAELDASRCDFGAQTLGQRSLAHRNHQ